MPRKLLGVKRVTTRTVFMMKSCCCCCCCRWYCCYREVRWNHFFCLFLDAAAPCW